MTMRGGGGGFRAKITQIEHQEPNTKPRRTAKYKIQTDVGALCITVIICKRVLDGIHNDRPEEYEQMYHRYENVYHVIYTRVLYTTFTKTDQSSNKCITDTRMSITYKRVYEIHNDRPEEFKQMYHRYENVYHI
jgi:hypothetical protein